MLVSKRTSDRMPENPIRVGVAPVSSPWGSFDVIVVPDDDDAARRLSFPADVIEMATQDHSVMDGRTMYVRATLWGASRASLLLLDIGSKHND